MSIPRTVQTFLKEHETPFEVVAHEPTVSSLRTANRAHIGASALAKAVLLEQDAEEKRYIMAVVPASRHVDLYQLSQQTGQAVHLATEDAAAGVFPDCETGALPPLGPAYGVETVWDDSLMLQPELYFEAGDHAHLVRVKTKDFVRLLQECPHGTISRPL